MVQLLEKRPIAVTSPLGEDVLRLRSMTVTEHLGRLTECNLDLISDNFSVKTDDLLGQKMTVKLELQNGETRYFNGHVSRFSQAEGDGRLAVYRVNLQSWLWFLTRTSDCRIFQEKTVPDIIKSIFREHGFTDFDESLSRKYRPWVYCVQYRETDFNFVSRLMEQEGIYYFIKHDKGKHTVVLCDSYGAHKPIAGSPIVYMPRGSTNVGRREHIADWSVTREVQPGTYALKDFDFEKPRANLFVKSTVSRKHTQAKHEVFDYPGLYVKTDDGDAYARSRIEGLHAQFEQAHAVGNAHAIAVGGLFKLTGHPREDQNREYLIVSATHELRSNVYEGADTAQAEPVYRCSFAAIESQQPYRASCLTPKPFVQGPQTAIVVGPAGDEIYTDKYGRVKVQFHWDRYGKNDENSSCWVRVAHPWAGKNWGMVAIPRIGQEVVVDFLEGDPDQPLITGRVYNADQMPPWDLPANKTQTGVLTRSSSGGAGANANAIRFEDKKGAEQLWIHAEKNQDIEVENDETHWVGHDRKKTIDNDETTHVKHDRTETVDNNETITIHGNRTETVDKDETITIHQNRKETVDINETITIGSNRTENVGANEVVTIALTRTHNIGAAEALNVGGARAQNVGLAESIAIGLAQLVNVGTTRSVNVGSNQSHKVGGNDT
ncbi:MAG TPA: type VI secretion system tip protein TssI/VgrG, partial [Burkholderiales bacterium]|nr:type VI secretion system tip protein TssI/VgrG [Burkholderiales bacterium]